MTPNAPSSLLATSARALCGLALLALPAAPALGAPADCRPIKALPALIDTPGLHCLTQDFETDLFGGAAIEIQADHVTVDFQGHTIDNRAAGGETIALGVFSWERSHIVVRNGTLIGFEEAVGLSGPFDSQDSRNHLVEGMRIVGSGRTGIGITGTDSIVRGNIVFDTGGHGSKGQAVSGIFLGGWRHRALDNDVNRVVGLAPVAIRFVEGGSHLAVGNRISGGQWAISFPVGQVGAYRDNLANEMPCCQPFDGGSDLGGNHWQ